MVTLTHSPVHSDPAVMGGTLVFRASRVPAQTLLDYLDDGYTLDEFLGLFPSVDRGDAGEFLALREARAMRVVLDENLPRSLMRIQLGHEGSHPIRPS